ncbi:MAG TPA: ATP-dependent DNA ligase [Devosia sp.]
MAETPDQPLDQSPLLPMEARSVAELPTEPGWQFEPKWDGFRCLDFKEGDKVRLYAKSGKPLGRYFPDVVERLAALPGDCILDGELVIPVGKVLSFDALQLRLHPAASRVKKLAAKTPAVFIAFDLLAIDGQSLTDKPLTERRATLEKLLAKPHRGLSLSPYSRDLAEAKAWLGRLGGALDGVVAKRLDGLYESGERAMLKVKRIRTADCVVGGFRYGANSKLVGSMLLGLFNDEDKLDHVGFTSSFARDEKPGLTEKLEALGTGIGFTGKAPGGPSRWSSERSTEFVSLPHTLVVEVQYDQVTGDRFRHGTTLRRWRPDKTPEQCRFDQLQQEAAPAAIIDAVLAA